VGNCPDSNISRRFHKHDFRRTGLPNNHHLNLLTNLLKNEKVLCVSRFVSNISFWSSSVTQGRSCSRMRLYLLSVIARRAVPWQSLELSGGFEIASLVRNDKRVFSRSRMFLSAKRCHPECSYRDMVLKYSEQTILWGNCKTPNSVIPAPLREGNSGGNPVCNCLKSWMPISMSRILLSGKPSGMTKRFCNYLICLHRGQ